MSLKSELEQEVGDTFRKQWAQRDGTVVPDEDSVKLGNDGVNLEAVVLYADMADSTQLVKNQTKTFAAEIYKTFLHCAGKIIRNESGTITAYDGDRIMAVFIDGPKHTNAVKAAMKMKYAVEEIIGPKQRAVYTSTDYVLQHVVGIDRSALFVANAGVRGAKDLVWVGNAANIAAKLSVLPHGYTYITKIVHDSMLDEVKLNNGNSIWEARKWSGYDGSTIYRSNRRWKID